MPGRSSSAGATRPRVAAFAVLAAATAVAATLGASFASARQATLSAQPVNARHATLGADPAGGALFAEPALRTASASRADSPIAFTSALGGSGSDVARAVAMDRGGNTYVAGDTSSAAFAATGVRRLAPRRAATAAFVAKLDATGRLVYATVFGGDRVSSGRGIAVDDAGRAYVAGTTNSTDFPTTRGALQRSYGGGPYDAFVTALDGRGRLRWSTLLGDTHYDEANAIAVDSSGRAVVAGKTVSPQFPRAGRLRPAVAGGAFVAKLDRTGSKLVFSTVFGGADRGNHGNTAFGVAVDRAGRTYATGVTNAASFPVIRALQPVLGGGGDAFAIKIDAAGRRVVYATYLGGGADDSGRAIAADAAGNAYLTGVTSSPDFPLRGPLPFTTAGADAFVAKLDPGGRALRYATRLGGAGDDAGAAIAVDARGAAYVSGRAGSADFPISAGAATSTSAPGAQVTGLAVTGAQATGLAAAGAQDTGTAAAGAQDTGTAAAGAQDTGTAAAGAQDTGTAVAATPATAMDAGGAAASPGGAFVTRLARNGASLGFSSRLDGTPTDGGLGIAVDRFGSVAVAGARGTDAFTSVLAPSPLVQVRRQLVPRGRGTSLRRLLRLGHAGLPFSTPAAGEVRVSWFAGRTRVASGSARFTAAGSRAIEVRLTPGGRRRLEHADRVELTARGVYSPADRPPVSAKTTFVLTSRAAAR